MSRKRLCWTSLHSPTIEPRNGRAPHCLEGLWHRAWEAIGAWPNNRYGHARPTVTRPALDPRCGGPTLPRVWHRHARRRLQDPPRRHRSRDPLRDRMTRVRRRPPRHLEGSRLASERLPETQSAPPRGACAASCNPAELRHLSGRMRSKPQAPLLLVANRQKPPTSGRNRQISPLAHIAPSPHLKSEVQSGAPF